MPRTAGGGARRFHVAHRAPMHYAIARANPGKISNPIFRNLTIRIIIGPKEKKTKRKHTPEADGAFSPFTEASLRPSRVA